jgi:hypothetical protein
MVYAKCNFTYASKGINGLFAADLHNSKMLNSIVFRSPIQNFIQIVQQIFIM